MGDDKIPVVNFGPCGLSSKLVEQTKPYSDEILSTSHHLGCAIEKYGFVYLKNHGIAARLVDEILKISSKFFELPLISKEKYKHQSQLGNSGWGSMETERVNPTKPGDLKEFYNYFPENPTIRWPDGEEADVPFFETVNKQFFAACTELSLDILKALGIALKPEEDDFFVDKHRYIGYPEKNQSTFRSLYYPPLTEEPRPGQLRLGEHSDYGSITLLFQDNIGGLEIANQSGKYIPAVPLPGAVLVNTGDLMQRWTADGIKAVRHRVQIPLEEFKLLQARRSNVFFVHPDNDVMITCIDGSQKYEAISSLDYLLQKLAATY